MRISDWSSDVCSSDLGNGLPRRKPQRGERVRLRHQFRGLIDDRNAGAAVALWPTDNRVPAEAGIQGHRAPLSEIGRAHVCTPVTNAPLVCRPLLDKINKTDIINIFGDFIKTLPNKRL